MNTTISQSMYFPWVGLLELIRLTDIFIHYDDVQYPRSRGGFYNRVQLKIARGKRLLDRSWGAKLFRSALDLIANCGKEGVDVMCSETIYWKEFLNEPK
jgi:hypothetical protein